MSTDNIAKLRNHRELAASKNIASWGFLGVIFPLLGLLICFIAKNRLNYVIEDEDNWDRIEQVRGIANFWIVMSLLFIVIWSMVSFILMGYSEDIVF